LLVGRIVVHELGVSKGHVIVGHNGNIRLVEGNLDFLESYFERISLGNSESLSNLDCVAVEQ